MDQDLVGRGALVTRGSRGIGRAIVEVDLRMPTLDLLINNEGSGAPTPFGDTELLQTSNPPDVVDQIAAATPLVRLGRPEDIAELVAFLASERASWITGQVIRVTGGL